MFSDEKHVIGVKKNNDEFIIIQEDITSGKSLCIGSHKKKITTLLFDEAKQFLYAANDKSIVFQYKRMYDNKWVKVKKFPKLGIFVPSSCIKFQNLLIYGGLNSRIAIVDTESKISFNRSFRVSIDKIHCLQICRFKEDSGSEDFQYLLTITGKYPRFLNNTSDVFDVTNLVQHNKKKSEIKIKSKKLKKIMKLKSDKGRLYTGKRSFKQFDMNEFLEEHAHELLLAYFTDKFKSKEKNN